jgi:Recombination endonuclease VII
MAKPKDRPSYVHLTREHTRKCKRCGRILALSCFYRNNEILNYSRSVCLECHQSKNEDSFEKLKILDAIKPVKTRVEKREYMRRFLYGLEPEEYEALLRKQHYVCPVCLKELPPDIESIFGPEAPNVDHDHSNGLVRGILHRKCNQGLGFFNDDPERLEQAAAYLRESKEVHAELIEAMARAGVTSIQEYKALLSCIDLSTLPKTV